eukprot:scaffold1328_cov375-Pavlova_lutheri.AAC.4
MDFFLCIDGLRSGSGGLRPEVQDICTGLHHASRFVQDVRRFHGFGRAIAEGVWGQVQNAHDHRTCPRCIQGVCISADAGFLHWMHVPVPISLPGGLHGAHAAQRCIFLPQQLLSSQIHPSSLGDSQHPRTRPFLGFLTSTRLALLLIEEFHEWCEHEFPLYPPGMWHMDPFPPSISWFSEHHLLVPIEDKIEIERPGTTRGSFPRPLGLFFLHLQLSHQFLRFQRGGGSHSSVEEDRLVQDWSHRFRTIQGGRVGHLQHPLSFQSRQCRFESTQWRSQVASQGDGHLHKLRLSPCHASTRSSPVQSTRPGRPPPPCLQGSFFSGEGEGWRSDGPELERGCLAWEEGHERCGKQTTTQGWTSCTGRNGTRVDPHEKTRERGGAGPFRRGRTGSDDFQGMSLFHPSHLNGSGTTRFLAVHVDPSRRLYRQFAIPTIPSSSLSSASGNPPIPVPSRTRPAIARAPVLRAGQGTVLRIRPWIARTFACSRAWKDARPSPSIPWCGSTLDVVGSTPTDCFPPPTNPRGRGG